MAEHLHDRTTTSPDLRRVRRIAAVMDTWFRIPGTPIRFGLDTVLGVLPIAGDTAGMIPGLVILMEAKRLGVGRAVLMRMAANLAIDWALGFVPLADLVFDTWYKANVRNVALLEEAVMARQDGRSVPST